MLAQRVELEKLSPFYCRTKGEYYFLVSGESVLGRHPPQAHYLKLVDHDERKKPARWVAMAPKQAKFSLDPNGLGHLERWFAPGYDRGGWQLLDTCKPFYLQAPGALDKNNFPYQGYMWYVFELPVPASAKGKPISVYSAHRVDDAWCG